MNTFNLELFEGHALINAGENKILIDTGSPATIHTSQDLNFCSESHRCAVNYMGQTVQSISALVGRELTTLLGSDILAKYKIMLDYRNQEAKFSKNDIQFDGERIFIGAFMGIPIIELSVNNRNLKFFLDTGAKLSYISSEFTTNRESVGTENDFYPGVGRFQTDCYSIMTRINNEEFDVRYANLPERLQSTLLLGGTNGIIGFDFFNTFLVALDLENKILKYRRHAT